MLLFQRYLKTIIRNKYKQLDAENISLTLQYA